MASLDAFEATLKEVVQAKRLSARKMTELTEIALKLMESDTQLVSILYRTHKSLPPASKVSSLYVFDALARAARHQVTKHGLTGSIYSEKGNSATFLLKVEGVLEGLFQDMVSAGAEGSKEKSQKILDIWVKGNTFPTTILSRLAKLVKEPEKVTEVEQVPFATSGPQVTSTTSDGTTQALDTQATLLALLTQAAATTIPEQTSTNTPLAAPSVDPIQLALLQQLAQNAINAPPTNNTTSAVISSRPSTRSPIPPFSPTGDRPASPVPPRDNHRDDNREGGNYGRYRSRSPDRTSSSEAFTDHWRGGFRGGFRGRGRGDPRTRWDDHDRPRDKERDRRRGVKSRSRSPSSRYPSRRDTRPYTPPGRHAPPSFQRPVDSSDTPHPDGKDEFGRDIRPQPPDDMDAAPDRSTHPTGSGSISVQHPVVESAPASRNNERVTMSPLVAANTSSNNSSAPLISNTIQSQPGLDSFDPTSFDPTSPSSWELLGKLWQVTYGETPTTERLMEYVMHAMAGAQATPATHTTQESQGSSWGGSGYGGFGGRGRGGPPRGGFNGYGNDRKSGNQYHENQTDAIVLGGGSDGAEDMDADSAVQENGRSTGGRMQKVGDKWVFVRDGEAR